MMRVHPIDMPTPWAWVWYYCDCGTLAEFWLSLFAALFHCQDGRSRHARIAMGGPLQCGILPKAGKPFAGPTYNKAILALYSYTVTVHPCTFTPGEIAAPAAETRETGPARGWARTAARIGAAFRSWYSVHTKTVCGHCLMVGIAIACCGSTANMV